MIYLVYYIKKSLNSSVTYDVFEVCAILLLLMKYTWTVPLMQVSNFLLKFWETWFQCLNVSGWLTVPQKSPLSIKTMRGISFWRATYTREVMGIIPGAWVIPDESFQTIVEVSLFSSCFLMWHDKSNNTLLSVCESACVWTRTLRGSMINTHNPPNLWKTMHISDKAQTYWFIWARNASPLHFGSKIYVCLYKLN